MRCFILPRCCPGGQVDWNFLIEESLNFLLDIANCLKIALRTLHEISPFEAAKRCWKCHIFITFCCILLTF